MKQELAHSEVEAFNVQTKTWKSWPSFNTGRHGSGFAIIGDYVYTASGCGKRGGSPELTSVERLKLPNKSKPTKGKNDQKVVVQKWHTLTLSFEGKNTYNFTNERRSTLAPKLQSQVRRDDYTSKQPNGSFDNRNKDVRNKADLDRSRRMDNTRTPRTRDNRNDRSRGTQSSPAQTNPSTPETRTSRGEKRANPTPSTGSSRSRNSTPSSTTPTTKKSTKRGN